MTESPIRFKLCDNKEFMTKRNEEALPAYTQKLPTKSTEKFPVFVSTITFPFHPVLLCSLGVKLADL
jgi:hypothetical protein